MAEDIRRDVIAGVPLFAGVLSAALVGALAAKSTVMMFPAGTTLMSEGDFGVAMYAVAEGTVAVSLVDRRGHEQEVAELGSGDIVGEMSLMTGARRNATVVATADVTALEITKVAFEDILKEAPELIDQFAAVLSTRQAELDRISAESDHDAHDIVRQIRRFFPSIFSSS